MTEQEFKEKHNLDDKDLARIKYACMTFQGKVCKVEDFEKPKEKV